MKIKSLRSFLRGVVTPLSVRLRSLLPMLTRGTKSPRCALHQTVQGCAPRGTPLGIPLIGSPQQAAGNQLINKNLFIAICMMLFVAIIIIAFLIGKQSVPQKESPEINPRVISSAQTSSPENIPINPPQDSDISKNQTSGALNPPKGVETNQPAQPQTIDASLKEKVKDYFQQMDSIGTLEEISGNSRELANQIVQNALNENYSEIDEIIQKCRRIKTSVEAITPPQPCVEFHAQVLESVDEASILYSDFKNFFQRKDESILKSISGKSTTLNSKMTGLDNMQKNIKLKYGIQ